MTSSRLKRKSTTNSRNAYPAFYAAESGPGKKEPTGLWGNAVNPIALSFRWMLQQSGLFIRQSGSNQSN